jgi:hypothetical protein
MTVFPDVAIPRGRLGTRIIEFNNSQTRSFEERNPLHSFDSMQRMLPAFG